MSRSVKFSDLSLTDEDISFINERVSEDKKEKKKSASSENERALKSAMNILAYADNTERRLRRKLAEKGFTPEAIEYAASYVIEKGYLDEYRMIDSAVRSLVKFKMYGKARVIAELHQKGFKREVIDSFDFGDIDFYDACRRMLEKRGGINDEKTRAYLLRHGHSSSDIKRAFLSLSSDDDL